MFPSVIFSVCNLFLPPCGKAIQFPGRPFLIAVCSCIEVDAVGYPDEHVAVGDAIVLGHTYADAVASLVDHRLEVTGGGMPNLKKPKQGQLPHGTF